MCLPSEISNDHNFKTAPANLLQYLAFSNPCSENILTEKQVYHESMTTGCCAASTTSEKAA